MVVFDRAYSLLSVHPSDHRQAGWKCGQEVTIQSEGLMLPLDVKDATLIQPIMFGLLLGNECSH